MRVRKLGARTCRDQFMCLSDRISDKVLNPTQKQVLKKAGLGLKKFYLVWKILRKNSKLN